ncbi:hypothetical protein CYY_007508 [Polysphondylium violaceum]|uniref:Uncharacterized protein n=1 Tax=Polysphondylium violaceum TaxID=133409 RepID=A0A8J4UXZ6_9MYCE|nr:hypothetical protein CYY_007508 [Polysphondylium violaceum]
MIFKFISISQIANPSQSMMKSSIKAGSLGGLSGGADQSARRGCCGGRRNDIDIDIDIDIDNNNRRRNWC